MASLPYTRGWKCKEHWQDKIKKCKGLKGGDFINAYFGINSYMDRIPANSFNGIITPIDEFKNVESYNDVNVDLELKPSEPMWCMPEPDYKKYLNFINKYSTNRPNIHH